MSDVCLICLESNGTLCIGYHYGCNFRVHQNCFVKWHRLHGTCIICRKSAFDISTRARVVYSIVMSVTFTSYIIVVYYILYKN